MLQLNKLLMSVPAILCLFAISTAMGQDLRLTGSVKERTTMNALPGANIVVKGTNLGTTTNEAGEFTLALAKHRFRQTHHQLYRLRNPGGRFQLGQCQF